MMQCLCFETHVYLREFSLALFQKELFVNMKCHIYMSMCTQSPGIVLLKVLLSLSNHSYNTLNVFVSRSRAIAFFYFFNTIYICNSVFPRTR